VAAELDDDVGLAIVTEGLLGYLPTDAVVGMWGRFADVLAGFPSGHYMSDLHLGGAQTAPVRVFRIILSAFVRGRVHLHFADAEEGETALRAAGFGAAQVRRAVDVLDGQGADDPGTRLAHILETSTR
jgi:O-methyltransferase involved in polyketide biosynthesis